MHNHEAGYETGHWDVAAYALGVLDRREIPSYERHLAGCPRCATELEHLLPASTLLADVDPDDLRDPEDSGLAGRLLEAVRAERRRVRARLRLALAAGATVTAAAAGLALFAGVAWLAAPPDPPDVAGPGAATASPAATALGIGGPDLGGGERFSTTDPTTGVHADLLLAGAEWGTQVSFALSSLPGPQECQLLVIPTGGTAEIAATWRVPADGYGTAAQPAPLLLQAATAVPRPEIAQLQVQAVEPGGTATVLLTITP